MLQLKNNITDAKHLGFTPYLIPNVLVEEVFTTLFEEYDYLIQGQYCTYYLRNPHAELMMLMKYELITRQIE